MLQHAICQNQSAVITSNNPLVNLHVDVRPSRYLAGLTAITVTKKTVQGTTDRMGMYYSLGWPALPFHEIFHSTLRVPSDTQKKNSLARANDINTYMPKMSWYLFHNTYPSYSSLDDRFGREHPLSDSRELHVYLRLPLACNVASRERQSSPPALASEFHTAHNTLVRAQPDVITFFSMLPWHRV